MTDSGIAEHEGELDWIADELKLYMNGLLKLFSGRLSFKNDMPVWSRFPAGRSVPGKLSLSVLKIISEIPYGQIKTYGSIAADAGNKGYARAVGGICGRNPLAIIIPCHRVVSSSGIGGYSAGIDRKRYLMNIEGLSPDMYDSPTLNPRSKIRF